MNISAAPVLDKEVGKVIIAWGNEEKPIPCRVKYSNPTPTISWMMQFLKFPRFCSKLHSLHNVNDCKPKDNSWNNYPPLLFGTGSFSPSNPSIPTMRSSYTPKVFTLVYYKCTATNSKGSDSMVFLFRRFPAHTVKVPK